MHTSQGDVQGAVQRLVEYLKEMHGAVAETRVVITEVHGTSARHEEDLATIKTTLEEEVTKVH
jgi:ribosomal protein L10